MSAWLRVLGREAGDFDPASNTDAARRVYRIAIDVSDVVPVVAAELRYWSIAE